MGVDGRVALRRSRQERLHSQIRDIPLSGCALGGRCGLGRCEPRERGHGHVVARAARHGGLGEKSRGRRIVLRLLQDHMDARGVGYEVGDPVRDDGDPFARRALEVAAPERGGRLREVQRGTQDEIVRDRHAPMRPYPY